MPPISDQCGVSLDVGVHAAQTSQLGPLMDTATDGPVTVIGSVEIGSMALEVHYDVDGPWNYDGGAEIIWTDIIEVRPIDPNDSVAKMRHRMRFTIASHVNNRAFPEDSQGWFQIESDGFEQPGTLGFVDRNLPSASRRSSTSAAPARSRSCACGPGSSPSPVSAARRSTRRSMGPR
jgi:hypothetical protein